MNDPVTILNNLIAPSLSSFSNDNNVTENELEFILKPRNNDIDSQFYNKVEERLLAYFECGKSWCIDIFDHQDKTKRKSLILNEEGKVEKEIDMYKSKGCKLNLEEFDLVMNIKSERVVPSTSNFITLPSLYRHKERKTFIVDKKKWKIELTKVLSASSIITHTNGSLSVPPLSIGWEIELEYIGGNFTGNIKDLCKQVMYWLKFVYGDTGEFVSKSLGNAVEVCFKQYFPFHKFYPRPINLRNHHLSTIKNSEFYVSSKVDGEHSFIFLSSQLQGIFNLNIIHKNFFITSILQFECPTDCILEAEVVYQNGIHTFYIYDVLTINNHLIINEVYVTRYRHISNILNILTSKLPSKIRFIPKPIYPVNKSSVKQVENSVGCKCDGLIFTQNGQYGPKLPIYKWKPIRLLTVDLQIIKRENNNGVYDLYIFNHNNNLEKIPYTFDSLNPIQNPQRLVTESGLVVEFSIDKSDNQLLFIAHRIRNDKQYPNHETVYNDMIENVNDPTDVNKFFS
jgi:hypothetical protein